MTVHVTYTNYFTVTSAVDSYMILYTSDGDSQQCKLVWSNLHIVDIHVSADGCDTYIPYTNCEL